MRKWLPEWPRRNSTSPGKWLAHTNQKRSGVWVVHRTAGDSVASLSWPKNRSFSFTKSLEVPASLLRLHVSADSQSQPHALLTPTAQLILSPWTPLFSFKMGLNAKQWATTLTSRNACVPSCLPLLPSLPVPSSQAVGSVRTVRDQHGP